MNAGVMRWLKLREPREQRNAYLLVIGHGRLTIPVTSAESRAVWLDLRRSFAFGEV